MEDVILSELQEIKKLTVLGAKKALTMSDAALLTGLSKSYLYKMCHSRIIPHWKSDGGKLTFFDKDELTKWLLSHRVKTVDEVEQQAANYIVAGKHSKNKRL